MIGQHVRPVAFSSWLDPESCLGNANCLTQSTTDHLPRDGQFQFEMGKSWIAPVHARADEQRVVVHTFRPTRNHNAARWSERIAMTLSWFRPMQSFNAARRIDPVCIRFLCLGSLRLGGPKPSALCLHVENLPYRSWQYFSSLT